MVLVEEQDLLKAIKSASGDQTEFSLSTKAQLWSLANPQLYDLGPTLGVDKVKSYFGMRKSSVAKDSKGIDRIMLNNKPYFIWVRWIRVFGPKVCIPRLLMCPVL